MKEKNEWAFDFKLTVPLSEANKGEIGEAILNLATSWAEQREFGIGGGFRVSEVKDLCVVEFQFGLTATREGQLIPATDAELLMKEIKQGAKKLGGTVEGGWRGFADSELEPILERTIQQSG